MGGTEWNPVAHPPQLGIASMIGGNGGADGLGDGGAGGKNTGGVAGTANTGGGGGGGGYAGATFDRWSGNGGSGIVIIRYRK